MSSENALLPRVWELERSLATAVRVNESLRQQLADHIKREVMLRKLIGEIYCSDDTGPDVMRKIEDTLNDIAELNKENGNAEL